MNLIVKRVQRLEQATDEHAPIMYVVTMSAEQADDDEACERALAELGVGEQGDLVVILRRFGTPIVPRLLGQTPIVTRP